MPGNTAISLHELGLGDEATIEEFAQAFAQIADEISSLHPPYCAWPSPQHSPESLALGAQIKAEIDALSLCHLLNKEDP